jgi:hypothetical protein
MGLLVARHYKPLAIKVAEAAQTVLEFPPMQKGASFILASAKGRRVL